jgi:hypothetical protein
MNRLLRLTLLALAAPLLLALPALASTVNWDETAKIDHAKVMHYQVDSITLGKTGWTAKVTFSNESKVTIKVGKDFGLAFYRDKHAEALAKAVGLAQASTFSSTVPTSLKPGQQWSGTISGKGTLTASDTPTYARVVFGPFTGLPGEKKSVVWITDHALTVPAGVGSAPAGNLA